MKTEYVPVVIEMGPEAQRKAEEWLAGRTLLQAIVDHVRESDERNLKILARDLRRMFRGA